MAQGPHAVIRIDEVWLAREPLDMRAGPETALARVINSFGEARHHCAYVFANQRANRMKVLVCDGFRHLARGPPVAPGEVHLERSAHGQCRAAGCPAIAGSGGRIALAIRSSKPRDQPAVDHTKLRAAGLRK
jgi:transposase